MLLPRFSLRTLLLATAACGVFFVVLAAAAQGQVWAAAVTIGVGSLAFAFLLYAVSFAMALVVASLNVFSRPAAVARSPFAQHVAAPQIIPQDDED